MYNQQYPPVQNNQYPGNYNQNYNQYYNPNYPQNYNPNFNRNYDPIENIKYNAKRRIKKASNGLGFFIFGYFLTMEVLAVILMLSFEAFNIDTSIPLCEYLMDVFLSVAAAFIPGLIYLAASRYRLSDGFGKTHVKPTVLIPLSLMGMGLAMVANYAADLFDTNISIFGLQNSASISSDSALSWLEMLIYIVAVSAVPAFAEEFAFRGIVMGRLRRYGNSFAIIVSAVMFGAMHCNTTQIIFAFILGLVFGYIDCATDSIVPSIILHFLNNFYAVVFDVIQNNSNLDDNTYYLLNLGVVVMFCIAGLISFVYLAKCHKDIFKISSKEKSPDEYSDYLSLKEKVATFFKNPGVIISLVFFSIITIVYLLPQNG